MTDTLLEQIKADRENGTQGPWRQGQSGNLRVYGPDGMGEHSGLVFDVETGKASKGRANARRIARVPDLEAAYIALTEARARDAETIKTAKVLARLVKQEADCYDPSDSGAEEMYEALAAFRAAQEKNDG